MPREPEAVLLGSAVLAAVAAGVFPSVLDAMKGMTEIGQIVSPARGPVRMSVFFGTLGSDRIDYILDSNSKAQEFLEQLKRLAVNRALALRQVMGKIYEVIDERIKRWIAAQPVFFVATAPVSAAGHINCSPKDGKSIRVLDGRTLVYVDLIGSGVETLAHLRENGRIIIMMCAFAGAPVIMRFHGIGEALETDHPDFEVLKALFDAKRGVRSFIRIRVDRISDSCGFGVPEMEFKSHRKLLNNFYERKGEAKLTEYKLEYNSKSIDGLEGIRTK